MLDLVKLLNTLDQDVQLPRNFSLINTPEEVLERNIVLNRLNDRELFQQAQELHPDVMWCFKDFLNQPYYLLKGNTKGGYNHLEVREHLEEFQILCELLGLETTISSVFILIYALIHDADRRRSLKSSRHGLAYKYRTLVGSTDIPIVVSYRTDNVVNSIYWKDLDDGTDNESTAWQWNKDKNLLLLR